VTKSRLTPGQLTRKLKIAFWLVFLITWLLFGAMYLWAMPAIRQYTPLEIFDLQGSGYTFNQARIFLESLGPEGTGIYMGQQQILDIFFPIFLTASVILAMYILAPVHWGYRRNLLIFVPLPAMTMDYLENALVRIMLDLGPDGITQDVVDLASKSTVLKFQLYGVSVLLLALLLALWARRKHRASATK